jgi:hypothetical protein
LWLQWHHIKNCRCSHTCDYISFLKLCEFSHGCKSMTDGTSISIS